MPSKKTAKRFPQELFITLEGEGEDSYFCASDSYDGFDDTVKVAIYELREVKRKVTTHSLIGGVTN